MVWPIIGKSFDVPGFRGYVEGLHWASWRPKFITLHNTASPTLAQRPKGFTYQHLLNLEDYYQGMGWRGGPHLFIDDHKIHVFNDLTKPGTHSPSWNGTAIGIEMLGDYDHEAFDIGRGLEVRRNTVQAIAALNKALQFDPQTLRLHKEDPNTTHACPGRNVIKSDVIADVQVAMFGKIPDAVPHEEEKALVLADVNVRDAPAGERIGGADQGSTVTVIERREGWVHVEYLDADTGKDAEGWINGQYIGTA